LVEHQIFQKSIMALIVINAFTLGAETSPTVMGLIGPQLLIFDKIVIVVFCVELCCVFMPMDCRFFAGPGIFSILSWCHHARAVE
jgi:voltage-gated sodium channel